MTRRRGQLALVVVAILLLGGAVGYVLPLAMGPVVLAETMEWGSARMSLRRVIGFNRTVARPIPPVQQRSPEEQQAAFDRQTAYHLALLPNISLCVHTEGWIGQPRDRDRITAIWVGKEWGFRDDYAWLTQHWDYPFEVDLTNHTFERWLPVLASLVAAGWYVRRRRRAWRQEDQAELDAQLAQGPPP